MTNAELLSLAEALREISVRGVVSVPALRKMDSAIAFIKSCAEHERTLLEQYDLDESVDYRKGYHDGRIKGYDVGYRHAIEHAAVDAKRNV